MGGNFRSKRTSTTLPRIETTEPRFPVLLAPCFIVATISRSPKGNGARSKRRAPRVKSEGAREARYSTWVDATARAESQNLRARRSRRATSHGAGRDRGSAAGGERGPA
jgi:hypothetical protein